MPELVPVTVRVTQETIRRYVHAGRTRGLIEPDASPEQVRSVVWGLMGAELVDAAKFLPAPPSPPPGKRSQTELRDASRRRSPDGVSAHTAALRTIRPERPTTT